jgi:hypothetical protein
MGWAWVRALGWPFFPLASGSAIHSVNVTAIESRPAAVANNEGETVVLPHEPAAWNAFRVFSNLRHWNYRHSHSRHRTATHSGGFIEQLGPRSRSACLRCHADS